MGPGNTSAIQASPNLPMLVPGVKSMSPRAGAIARRMKTSKRSAMDAGKLSNTPDDKTSFEGI